MPDPSGMELLTETEGTNPKAVKSQQSLLLKFVASWNPESILAAFTYPKTTGVARDRETERRRRIARGEKGEKNWPSVGRHSQDEATRRF